MKIESSLLLIFLIGAISKFLQLPGSILFFVATLMITSFLYFIFAFYIFCDKTITQQNLWYSIISGILLSTVPIGILFKLMYWYDWKVYLSVGTGIALFLLALSLFLKSKSPPHLFNYYRNMVMRTAMLSLIFLILYFTPINALMNLELSKLTSLINKYPTQTEYQKKIDDLKSRIDSVKAK
jgi:hypothetical protein